VVRIRYQADQFLKFAQGGGNLAGRSNPGGPYACNLLRNLTGYKIVQIYRENAHGTARFPAGCIAGSPIVTIGAAWLNRTPRLEEHHAQDEATNEVSQARCRHRMRLIR
jgi:hypothetical protein